MSKLLYVGQQVADDLAEGVADNIERYREGDFLDLASKGDWSIPLSIDADVGELSKLKQGKTPEDEIENSLLVGRVLRDLTPTLARENRVWIRLSHIDCLEYARKRWLSEANSDQELEKSIRKHMFAPTLTACRDDHAISRLWWNYRIAKQMVPENPARALKVILARADIRLSLIERARLAARPMLGRGIVRALETNNDLLRKEELFRVFMKKVNLLGAGIVFEVMNDAAVDRFMDECLRVSNVSEAIPA